MITFAFKPKSILYCLAISVACVANAQVNSYKVLGWSSDAAKLTTTDGGQSLQVDVGMTIGAKSKVCGAATQLTAVVLLVQPAEGGEARHITVPSGGKQCPIVDEAWRDTGMESNHWLRTLYNVLRSDAGAARITASTAGSATISKGAFNPPVVTDPCLVQPVAQRKRIFVPPGATNLTFFTTMPEGTVTTLVNWDGKPLVTSKVRDGKLSLPAQQYDEGQRYQVRSDPGNGAECKFSIETKQAPQMLEDKALQSRESYAGIAVNVLNDPKQIEWHAYVLQTLDPWGRNISDLRATVWDWWWAKQQP